MKSLLFLIFAALPLLAHTTNWGEAFAGVVVAYIVLTAYAVLVVAAVVFGILKYRWRIKKVVIVSVAALLLAVPVLIVTASVLEILNHWDEYRDRYFTRYELPLRVGSIETMMNHYTDSAKVLVGVDVIGPGGTVLHTEQKEAFPSEGKIEGVFDIEQLLKTQRIDPLNVVYIKGFIEWK